jgi:hypothetical protein
LRGEKNVGFLRAERRQEELKMLAPEDLMLEKIILPSMYTSDWKGTRIALGDPFNNSCNGSRKKMMVTLRNRNGNK